MATIQELESFKMSDAVKFHNELNPNLWINSKLDPEVRDQLLLIADDFISTLGISDLDVVDITVSGSNAAYSYTPHSDLDLHILVNMSKLRNDEIYRELFTAKKTLYNDSHNITVHDVPVELYVQDVNEPVKSLGEYSVLNDKWIRIPKKQRANFDQAATKAKFDNLAEIVELALKTEDLDRVEKAIATIKRYRKAGLDKAGEFGPENLAFKAIRKQGGIQDLYDLRDQLRSEKLSIEESPRQFQPQTNPLEHLIQAYGYFTSLGNVHLDKQGETPEAQQQLLALVQRLNKDGKTFANLDKQKMEVNRDVILNHIHQMMSYAIPILKKYLPADKFDAKRSQVNSVLQAYNDATQINEEQLDETAHESQLVNLISKRAAAEIFKMLRKKESTLSRVIAPDTKRDKLQSWGISAEKLGVPYINDPVLGSVLRRAKFIAADYINPLKPKRVASYDPTTHEIMVHYPLVVRDASDYGYETEQYLAKIIAHELQHAVDNFKSRGRAFDTNKTAYATLPYEINARFQEALMNMTIEFDDARKRGKILNRSDLPRFVDGALEHNIISQYLPKDGKRYKQLAKRAYKFFDAEFNNPKQEKPLSFGKRAINYILGKPTGTVNEASGYIPSEKEKNDPRFKTALTVDVKPDAIKKNAKAFSWKTSRAGIPPQARADGKITEALVSYTPDRKFANEAEEVQHICSTVKDFRVRFKILESLGSKTLVESKQEFNDLCTDVVRSFGSLSSKNLKIGNTYIPAQVVVHRNAVAFYDVKNNSPAHVPAEFGTLVQLDSNAATVKIGDTTYQYPVEMSGTTTMIMTVFLDTVEKYDQFRMLAELKFDQTLPPYEAPVDTVTESLMKEWNAFLAEDEKLDEKTFYPKQVRQQYLDPSKPWATGEYQNKDQPLGGTTGQLPKPIHDYVGSSFGLNKSLVNQKSITGIVQNLVRRLKGGQSYSEPIKELDSLLAKSLMPHDTIVYHGTHKFNPGELAAKGGGKITIPSYTSTSTDKNVAYHFSGARYGDGHIIEISLKKGQPAFNIGGMEGEVLLPRNTTLQIDPDPTELPGKSYLWHAQIVPKSVTEDEQQELFPGYDEQHREKRLGDWLQSTHAWDGHKPITFYHATTKDFDTFNTHGTGFASALGMAFEVERHGSFFAVDPKFAETFIEDPNTREYKVGGRVIPVHLSVQNPIDLRDNNLSYMLRDEETVDGFKANDIDLRSIYYHVPEDMRWELFDGVEGEDFVNNLQKLGFDGAIINEAIPNDSNARSGEVWVVFNPNQVKAIHNRGSYSPDDPNIMKENG